MSKKTVTLGARIPATLHRKLNAAATKLKRTQKSIVEDALRNYLDDEEDAERVSNYLKPAERTAEVNDTKLHLEQLKRKDQ